MGGRRSRYGLACSTRIIFSLPASHPGKMQKMIVASACAIVLLFGRHFALEDEVDTRRLCSII